MSCCTNEYLKMIHKEKKNFDIIKVTFVDKETISGKSILNKEKGYTSTTFFIKYWDAVGITPEEVFMEMI